MKKMIFLGSLLSILLAVNCFAVGSGVGVRSIAMGGTGIATANDITAAYFNPAGLMYGPENFEAQAMAGGAISGLMSVAESLGQPDKFIVDNFDKDIRTSGSISAGLGVSVKKVGLSVFANGNANFHKPANALAMNFNANVEAYAPLTLGSTFSTPGLPFASMSVGVNLKSITVASVIANVNQNNLINGTGSITNSIGSGFGFDIGAQAKITPLITVGAVIRNLSASTSIVTKTQTISVDAQPDGSAKSTTTDLPDARSTYNPPAEVGVGAGIVIPITGTLLAMDLENYSSPDPDHPKESLSHTDTHLGVEQGVLFNMVMLRAGYYTYGVTADSFWTYGLGFNLGPVDLGVAAANSVKDSNNSISSAQLGMAF
jgi:hypothetical protein